jgi:hypothetical protein
MSETINGTQSEEATQGQIPSDDEEHEMSINGPGPIAACPHCGASHQTTCPRIKSIEYNQNGTTIKKIEFHEQRAEIKGWPLSDYNLNGLAGTKPW